MKANRGIKEIEALLPQIKALLERIYGKRLVDIILFGSFAKDEAKEDSDIDIAVVLKGEVSKAKEIDRIYDVMYDLMLDTSELLSIYPVSDEELTNSVWPLYDHIRTEGIRI